MARNTQVNADHNAPPITLTLARFVATHPSRGWSDAVDHEAHRTFLNWLGCAHGTAQPVQEGAVRLMVHRVAPTPRGVGGHEAGQGLGDGWCVVVGIDLGVAGHEDS